MCVHTFQHKHIYKLQTCHQVTMLEILLFHLVASPSGDAGDGLLTKLLPCLEQAAGAYSPLAKPPTLCLNYVELLL